MTNQTPEQPAIIAELLNAGNAMSSICFNIAQSGEIGKHVAETMDASRKRWDKAREAHFASAIPPPETKEAQPDEAADLLNNFESVCIYIGQFQNSFDMKKQNAARKEFKSALLARLSPLPPARVNPEDCTHPNATMICPDCESHPAVPAPLEVREAVAMMDDLIQSLPYPAVPNWKHKVVWEKIKANMAYPGNEEKAFKAGFDSGANYHATFHGWDNAAARDSYKNYLAATAPPRSTSSPTR